MSAPNAVPVPRTMASTLAIVARTPSMWPRFALFLGKFVIMKVRFYGLCWRAGYRVATVRRLARLERLTHAKL